VAVKKALLKKIGLSQKPGFYSRVIDMKLAKKPGFFSGR
jgi:hypothetical protein